MTVKYNPHGCFLLAWLGLEKCIEHGVPSEIHRLAGVTADRSFSYEEAIFLRPLPHFFFLHYWVLSKFPSLWQGTSAMVMTGDIVKSNKGIRFSGSNFLDLQAMAFRFMEWWILYGKNKTNASKLSKPLLTFNIQGGTKKPPEVYL